MKNNDFSDILNKLYQDAGRTNPMSLQAVLDHKKSRLNPKRPIYEIAQDIRKEWKKVNYAAKPYLDAMYSLNSIKDNFMFDSARSVVSYFLSNASSFKGEHAKELKQELKNLLK